jgi:hypothetical protein
MVRNARVVDTFRAVEQIEPAPQVRIEGVCERARRDEVGPVEEETAVG